jgi:hypothetical protein
MTRQQQQEIRSYAAKVGLEVVRFEKRSKHDAAILSNGRRSRFITLSATPSDFRTGYAVERDIRKVARELREQEPTPAPVIEQLAPEPHRPWLAPPVEIATEPKPAPLAIVYYYTTSAALPFIMQRDYLHDLNDRDLHATESKNGEKTDTGKYRNGNGGRDPYRAGAVQRVRFAVHAEDFTHNGGDDYTRTDPLPLDRVIACDVRSYLGHKWTPFDLNSKPYKVENENVPEGKVCLGVEIGDKIYAAYEDELVMGLHSAWGFVALTPFKLEAEMIL